MIYRGATRNERIEPTCAISIAYPFAIIVFKALPNVNFPFQVTKSSLIQRVNQSCVTNRTGVTFFYVLRQMTRHVRQSAGTREYLSVAHLDDSVGQNFGYADSHLFGEPKVFDFGRVNSHQ